MVDRRGFAERRAGGGAGPWSASAAARAEGGGEQRRLRGPAAREAKRSAHGAARAAERAAPLHGATKTRRVARTARDAPVMPLVALAREFAPHSRQHWAAGWRRPSDDEIPCDAGARRREPRTCELGRGRVGATVRAAPKGCPQAAPRHARGWAGGGARCLAQRPWRGGNVAPEAPHQTGAEPVRARRAAAEGRRASCARRSRGRAGGGARRLTQRPRRGKRGAAQHSRVDDGMRRRGVGRRPCNDAKPIRPRLA